MVKKYLFRPKRGYFFELFKNAWKTSFSNSEALNPQKPDLQKTSKIMPKRCRSVSLPWHSNFSVHVHGRTQWICTLTNTIVHWKISKMWIIHGAGHGQTFKINQNDELRLLAVKIYVKHGIRSKALYQFFDVSSLWGELISSFTLLAGPNLQNIQTLPFWQVQISKNYSFDRSKSPKHDSLVFGRKKQ